MADRGKKHSWYSPHKIVFIGIIYRAVTWNSFYWNNLQGRYVRFYWFDSMAWCCTRWPWYDDSGALSITIFYIQLISSFLIAPSSTQAQLTHPPMISTHPSLHMGSIPARGTRYVAPYKGIFGVDRVPVVSSGHSGFLHHQNWKKILIS
jgi:hypothetical protein